MAKCLARRAIRYQRCTQTRDDGYNRCTQTRDNGYNRCTQTRDNGYNRCTQTRDNGYNSCADWRSRCCDWWPCSWACELVSWFCFAWVWVSNIVCVAWVWVSNIVCIAWVWVSNIVCVAWVWISHVVCITWAWVETSMCLLYCWITDLFNSNEVSKSMSECKFGWTAAFRMDENRQRCTITVTLRIRLQPDADITAAEIAAGIARWEPAIEREWSNQFLLVTGDTECDCLNYTLAVDVQFVNGNEHHVLIIERGPGRENMGRWFHDTTGQTSAHEAGHMFGNPDEYAEPDVCPNRVTTNDDSIMSSGSTVHQRHYKLFQEWVSKRTCCNYEVRATD